MLRSHHRTDAVALGLIGAAADDACVADKVFAGWANRRDIRGTIVLLGDGIGGRSHRFAPEE